MHNASKNQNLMTAADQAWTQGQTDELHDMLENACARAAKMEADARAERLELEKALRLARGTRPHVAVPLNAMPVTSLADRIENVLRAVSAPIGMVELARMVGETAGKVSAEFHRMRAEKCPTRSLEDAPDARVVFNHGTDYEPRWAWVIGDQTPTSELSAAVEKMITVRPYTFAELTLATGARRGRLSGVLVRFQRDGRDIVNEDGTDRQYRWKMRPARARRATKQG